MFSVNEKTILCALLVFALGTCKAPTRQEGTTAKGAAIPAGDSERVIDDAHSSRNALDWNGVYQGVLPCADCAGVKTTVILLKDGRYIRKTQYQGRDEKVFAEEGTFTWNDAGSTVMLKVDDETEQQYKVGEHVLFHLDRDGNMITGALADKYKLEKNRADARIEDITWVLTELKGQSADDPDRRGSAYLVLEHDLGSIRGHNSCNSFAGSYELLEQDGIRIGDMAGTLMACPDMEIADTFMLVLDQAHRYSVRDNVLSFADDAGEPLAVFRAGPD